MTEIEMRPDVSEKMTRALNNQYHNNNIEYGLFRTPDFHVYIYSVSAKTFEVRRPPQIPLLILKACPPGVDYIEVAKIPDPFVQSDRHPDNGTVIGHKHPARQIAQDIVCPAAADMDSALPPDAYTVDLRDQGVFWSMNNPPLESEWNKATKRLETYYRKRLERNVALEYSNPKELAERIGEDDHLAADFFGEEYSWHKARVRKVTPAAKVACPVCGDDIKAGVAFHRDSEGEYCILDWKRAYDAGRVTKKQVPEDKRWEGFTL